MDIKIAQGQETRKCKDCGRVGCWTETTEQMALIISSVSVGMKF